MSTTVTNPPVLQDRDRLLEYARNAPESFNLRQAYKALEISRPKMMDLLGDLVQSGDLINVGDHSTPRYRVRPEPDPFDVRTEWMGFFLGYFQGGRTGTPPSVAAYFRLNQREVEATLEALRREGSLTARFIGSIGVYGLSDGMTVRQATPEELRKESREAALQRHLQRVREENRKDPVLRTQKPRRLSKAELASQGFISSAEIAQRAKCRHECLRVFIKSHEVPAELKRTLNGGFVFHESLLSSMASEWQAFREERARVALEKSAAAKRARSEVRAPKAPQKWLHEAPPEAVVDSAPQEDFVSLVVAEQQTGLTTSEIFRLRDKHNVRTSREGGFFRVHLQDLLEAQQASKPALVSVWTPPEVPVKTRVPEVELAPESEKAPTPEGAPKVSRVKPSEVKQVKAARKSKPQKAKKAKKSRPPKSEKAKAPAVNLPGLKASEVAKRLKVSHSCVNRWVKRWPEVVLVTVRCAHRIDFDLLQRKREEARLQSVAPNEEFVTLAEAARRLGVRPKGFNAWVSRSGIRQQALVKGKRTFIPVGVLDAYLAEQEKKKIPAETVEVIPEGFLTRAQAADALRVTVRRVARLIQEGKLHAVLCKHSFYIRPAEVEALAALERSTDIPEGHVFVTDVARACGVTVHRVMVFMRGRDAPMVVRVNPRSNIRGKLVPEEHAQAFCAHIQKAPVSLKPMEGQRSVPAEGWVSAAALAEESGLSEMQVCKWMAHFGFWPHGSKNQRYVQNAFYSPEGVRQFRFRNHAPLVDVTDPVRAAREFMGLANENRNPSSPTWPDHVLGTDLARALGIHGSNVWSWLQRNPDQPRKKIGPHTLLPVGTVAAFLDATGRDGVKERTRVKPEGWLDVPECARQIGRSASKVHEWISAGKLRAVHAGPQLAVCPEDLRAMEEKLIEARKVPEGWVAVGDLAAEFKVARRAVLAWMDRRKIPVRVCLTDQKVRMAYCPPEAAEAYRLSRAVQKPTQLEPLPDWPLKGRQRIMRRPRS